jgi:hypothetical protein
LVIAGLTVLLLVTALAAFLGWLGSSVGSTRTLEIRPELLALADRLTALADRAIQVLSRFDPAVTKSAPLSIDTIRETIKSTIESQTTSLASQAQVLRTIVDLANTIAQAATAGAIRVVPMSGTLTVNTAEWRMTPPGPFKHTEIIAAGLKANKLIQPDEVPTNWATTYDNGVTVNNGHTFKSGDDELYGGFGPRAKPLSELKLAERGQSLKQVNFNAKFKSDSKAEVRIDLLMLEY